MTELEAMWTRTGAMPASGLRAGFAEERCMDAPDNLPSGGAPNPFDGVMLFRDGAPAADIGTMFMWMLEV
ncbi:hypothetical protein [Bacteriophage sp.]|nr:hypothetical protein [Bacteriophage sp.]